MGANEHRCRNKIQVETPAKERYQQLLDFITIDILKLEWQYPSSQYIITLPMTPIINISINKHPMSWELVHFRLLHPFYSVVKSMCHHQTLDGLPKYFPKEINKTPCTICYTEKLQLATRAQQLKSVTFNQDNSFTWNLTFIT